MGQTASARSAAFVPPTADELGFAPAALRARYLAERDRRLRSEGNDQYREVTGELKRFVDDPYIESALIREPIRATTEVVIIGGGFGGQLAAARLQEAGIRDFRIIERAGDFGGTWYWNRYPGAQCDIESYIYLPLLAEVGYIPKEKYSYQPEIFEHAKRIARHYDLYPRTHFQTKIESVRWTDLFKALARLLNPPADSGMQAADIAYMSEIADFQKMNEIRARVAATVEDPATAEALKPWYRQWCKRPTFNGEFLPTFNRPNVTLVETAGHGVERVTPHGVIVQGVEYPVDCLIFATGFEVGTAYTRRSEFEVFGRGGTSLSQSWATGMRTFHGFYSQGFPNLFHMGLTQTGIGPNLTYMLNGQAQHIGYVIEQANARGARCVEATPEAEAAWVETVYRPNFMSDYLSQCTPGYYNGEGRTGKREGLFDGQYGDGAVHFFDLLERWREQGDLEGLVFD